MICENHYKRKQKEICFQIVRKLYKTNTFVTNGHGHEHIVKTHIKGHKKMEMLIILLVFELLPEGA